MLTELNFLPLLGKYYRVAHRDGRVSRWEEQETCGRSLEGGKRGLPFMTSAPRGGGGVSGKADEGRELSKGGCVNLRTGREGVKKSKNFADVINGSPLNVLQPQGDS